MRLVPLRSAYLSALRDMEADEMVIIYDTELDAVLDDTHLAIMVRQIAWLCTIDGGLDIEGHHYTWAVPRRLVCQAALVCAPHLP